MACGPCLFHRKLSLKIWSFNDLSNDLLVVVPLWTNSFQLRDASDYMCCVFTESWWSLQFPWRTPATWRLDWRAPGPRRGPSAGPGAESWPCPSHQTPAPPTPGYRSVSQHDSWGSNMTHHDRIWLNITQHDSSWQNMTQHNSTWQNMTQHNSTNMTHWESLTQYDMIILIVRMMRRCG